MHMKERKAAVGRTHSSFFDLYGKEGFLQL